MTLKRDPFACFSYILHFPYRQSSRFWTRLKGVSQSLICLEREWAGQEKRGSGLIGAVVRSE